MGVYILGTGLGNSECCGCAGRELPCDTPGTGLLVFRNAEASLIKCGFEEFSSPSDPPKYYLTKSLSGGIENYFYLYDNTCTSCTGGIELFYSDSCTYGSLTAAVCEANSEIEVLQSNLDTDCSSIISQTTYYVNCDPFALITAGLTATSTQTQRTISGDATCVLNNLGTYEKYIGSVYEDLSNEYTTQMLTDNVDSLIPSFTGPFSNSPGEPGGYFTLNDDETIVYKGKSEYKFELPSLTGYLCYQLTWAELLEPATGAPVYTSFTYTWNGTDTETPIYESSVPTYPGVYSVVSVAFSCVCA